MQETRNRLDKAMNYYKQVQKEQLSLLDCDTIPDIESLRFYRASAFADLKNNLDHFLNFVHDDINLLNFYKNQLSLIMETDQKLRQRISDYRDLLKRRMAVTASNKRAINGYARTARTITQ